MQRFRNLRGPIIHQHANCQWNRTFRCGVIVDSTAQFSRGDILPPYSQCLVDQTASESGKDTGLSWLLHNARFMLRACYFFSKPMRLKGQWARKSRPNFGLLTPYKTYGRVSEMSACYFHPESRIPSWYRPQTYIFYARCRTSYSRWIISCSDR